MGAGGLGSRTVRAQTPLTGNCRHRTAPDMAAQDHGRCQITADGLREGRRAGARDQDIATTYAYPAGMKSIPTTGNTAASQKTGAIVRRPTARGNCPPYKPTAEKLEDAADEEKAW